jgi:pimeloyl-ACP methyl ester carboxylesterase
MILKNLFCIFYCLSLSCGTHLIAQEEKIAKIDHIEICYETFGDKKNPAFLLIMGEQGQGIVWPTKFCELLAQKGFYVIRYDQRDSGLSSCIDFEKNPYTLLDLAEDAVHLLDALGIKKAHLFGLGMGGTIAELIASKYPERVASLAVMGTEFDLRPYNLAMEGLPQKPGLLSPPKEEYLQKLKEIQKTPATTDDEKVEKQTEEWNLLLGRPLDENATRAMAREYLKRSLHSENLKNYSKAMLRSEDMVQAVHSKVLAPTIIFLGSEDPLLGYDHVEALARAIHSSDCYYVQGLGHLLDPNSFEFLIEQFDEHEQRRQRANKKPASSPQNQ